MSEVAIENAPQKVKDLFNKGFAALERGNLDYAIDLLSTCVEIEPGVLKARRFLRAAQVQKRKAQKVNALTSLVTMLKALPQIVSTLGMVKAKKGPQALSQAEKLLAHDPLNPMFALLAADAAQLCELPEAATMTLEVVHEHLPNHTKVLHRLADIYMLQGDTKTARDYYERLNELHPNNPALVKAYKDAMALHSMARDGWQQASAGGTFRDIMKDTDEAQRLEQDAKAVKSDKDVDALVTETLAKLQAEPENLNYYRALARLYLQKQMFEEAITTVEEALQRSPGDPELDQMVSNIRIQQMDVEIKQLRAAGEDDAAQNREVEKAQFMLSDLEDRVKRYPNDLRLRYDLGVALYEADRTNEAIGAFQGAQRSPKHRTRALYYLALCFKQKTQYDMAAQQLTAAAADIGVMDATKKDILYELGSLSELMGKKEDALKYYKEIYQVDISYKDVSAKVENMYKG